MCTKNLRLGVVKDNPLVTSLFNKLDNLFVVGGEAIPLSNKITERFHHTHQLFIEQLVYLGAPKAVFEFRDPITPAVDRSLLAVQQCLGEVKTTLNRVQDLIGRRLTRPNPHLIGAPHNTVVSKHNYRYTISLSGELVLTQRLFNTNFGGV